MSALALGALLVVPASFAATTPARAALHAFECTHALDPADRAVAVTATIRPLAGTERMQVKFELMMSVANGREQRVVRAGDLGVWINPHNPTLGQLPGDVWNLQKSVVALAAPASYRFKVAFRWLGAHRRVLETETRFTRRCHQRELRPDLLVSSITVTPVTGQPAEDLYTALIANHGNSGAGPFDVLFTSADGSTTITRTVKYLKAHAQREENFVGPACDAGTDPTVIADSADQIDDLNRANNSLTAVCPGSS
jgi:hypothetical protein